MERELLVANWIRASFRGFLRRPAMVWNFVSWADGLVYRGIAMFGGKGGISAPVDTGVIPLPLPDSRSFAVPVIYTIQYSVDVS